MKIDVHHQQSIFQIIIFIYSMFINLFLTFFNTIKNENNTLFQTRVNIKQIITTNYTMTHKMLIFFTSLIIFFYIYINFLNNYD